MHSLVVGLLAINYSYTSAQQLNGLDNCPEEYWSLPVCQNMC